MIKRNKDNEGNSDLQNTTKKTKRHELHKNISVNSGALEICFINHGGHCLGDGNLNLNLSSVSDEEYELNILTNCIGDRY
jgi:hypothetical protein